MDILFSELKKKDVIDVCSGKKLGKVRDVAFAYPEGHVKSISVSGGVLGCGETQTVSFRDIERIGTDAVLVRFGTGKKPHPNKCKPTHCEEEKPCNPPHRGGERHFRIDEEDYE